MSFLTVNPYGYINTIIKKQIITGTLILANIVTDMTLEILYYSQTISFLQENKIEFEKDCNLLLDFPFSLF